MSIRAAWPVATFRLGCASGGGPLPTFTVPGDCPPHARDAGITIFAVHPLAEATSRGDPALSLADPQDPARFAGLRSRAQVARDGAP